MGGDFGTIWETPNILKRTFHAETALVASDSQIYTYAFMQFLHKMYFLKYLELLILCQSRPHVKATPIYGMLLVITRAHTFRTLNNRWQQFRWDCCQMSSCI